MSTFKGIHTGTSGWNYDGWKGLFYPENIHGDEMLSEYAKVFPTVEVNNTFYSLPKPETVRNWCGYVPEDFIFSVKASQYITHMKKLKDPREPLDNLFEILEAFGNKLGPVLFQLPPNWGKNVDRLNAFLECLPADFRYTFEFRNPDWFCDEIIDRLKEKGVACCFYDYETRQSPKIYTADFLYMRLHGPEKQAYQGRYGDDALKTFTRYALNARKSGRAVFCYFDNDEKARAPGDAERLSRRIKRDA
ncbi:MAG: DUF72 domain-containing protein [Kiritimatiellia bacterium]